MPSTVLVGAQWGDEGKGKITDLIASDYEYVVRFQGGNHAGHTVIHGDKKLALHLTRWAARASVCRICWTRRSSA